MKLHQLFEQEDWQADIDDDGAGIGKCPRCGGEARYNDSDPKKMKTRWRCEDCGHRSK